MEPTHLMSRSIPDTERQAIEACRHGRIEGLRELYERYGTKVHRTCYRILGERAAAEDATQDIFLHVFRRIDSFEGRSRFSTWLYRVSVNYALGILGRERTRRRVTSGAGLVHGAGTGIGPGEAAPPGAGPEQAVLRGERQARLTRALSELSPTARTVIVLREIEELSYREIGQVLAIPLGTVMSRLSRARADLRARWLASSDARGIDRADRLSQGESDR